MPKDPSFDRYLDEEIEDHSKWDKDELLEMFADEIENLIEEGHRGITEEEEAELIKDQKALREDEDE